MTTRQHATSDFLVIGSGLAGLAYALKVAHLGKVTVLSKKTLSSGNTPLAQGGIAAVESDKDSFDQHAQDTIQAGAGLCHNDIVESVVKDGPERIRDLESWGIAFDLDNGGHSLTREGGHSQRRILHVRDHTGKDIQTQLLQQVEKHPNIEVLQNHLAIDLIMAKKLDPFCFGPDRCLGAYVLDKDQSEVLAHMARFTVLATGGAGKVYLYTSNWSGATGDGVAMAYRAGARVANLEFMQFHPTCLYHPLTANFLISESLRGEGGELINSKGESFMQSHHPMGSLAPRDVVARSIDAEIKRSGADCVYLDMTHKSKDYLQKRFPIIFQGCQKLGIDISQQPIPVVPAAHYLCGGVMTDLNGHTDIDGLLALGEVACTGLHGANRLASNSLLECMVFSHNASKWTEQNMDQYEVTSLTPPAWPLHDKENPDELTVITHMWDEIRRLMWNYVGIVRTDRRLERAQHRLNNILREIEEYYWNLKTHPDIVELRNIAIVAELTVKCALRRKESRGIHYNLDHPTLLEGSKPMDTVINPATQID